MEPVDSVGEWVGFLAGVVVIGAVIAGVVLGFAQGSRFLGTAATDVFQAACGFDPTDSCNWSVVVVRNDTGSTVRLEVCNNHCGKGDYRESPIVLPPGRMTPTGQYVGIRVWTGLHTWVAVVRHDGSIGCLVLDGHSHKRDGDLVLVSEAGPCGDSHSPATAPVGRVRV